MRGRDNRIKTDGGRLFLTHTHRTKQNKTQRERGERERETKMTTQTLKVSEKISFQMKFFVFNETF